MSGISVLKQKMREKMGTARGLSAIPEVSAGILIYEDFSKHITKIDKAFQSNVKSLRGAASAITELSGINSENGSSLKLNLESYRKIPTILQTLSDYEKEVARLWNELAGRLEADIQAQFKSILNEALYDAKQQIAVFEKARLQADAAASEYSAVQKKEKNEQKLEQSRANSEAKMKDFHNVGNETVETLTQLFASVEADTIDLLCNYLEILSNTFNNALRASNELVPVMFQTQSYIQELREKHAGSTHARQSGDGAAPTESVNRLFGRPLGEVIALDKSQVPNIVTALIQYVEQKHIDAEGLYWRGVAATDLVVIKRGFDAIGKLPDPDVLQSAEAAASLLKSYFRELPEPLLTRKLFAAFVETNNIRDPREKAIALAGVAQQLPSEHKICAARLFGHLYNVADNGATNLMSAGRLASAWASILLVAPAGTVSEDPFEIRAVVETLIESAPLVFSS